MLYAATCRPECHNTPWSKLDPSVRYTYLEQARRLGKQLVTGYRSREQRMADRFYSEFGAESGLSVGYFTRMARVALYLGASTPEPEPEAMGDE